MTQLSRAEIDQYMGVVRSTFQNRSKLSRYVSSARSLTGGSSQHLAMAILWDVSLACLAKGLANTTLEATGSGFPEMKAVRCFGEVWDGIEGFRMAVWAEWMEEPWEEPVEGSALPENKSVKV